MGIGTQYVIEYITDLAKAMAGAKDLQRLNGFVASSIGREYANMTAIIGKSFDKLSKEKIIKINGADVVQQTREIGIVAKTATGKFQELSTSFTFLNGQLQNKVPAGLKEVTNQFTKTNIEVEKGKKNFLSLTDNMGRLASRALLTIPVWMLLRNTIMGFFKSISDGFKTIIEQDRIFAKLRKNLQSMAGDIDGALNKTKKTISDFSVESGKSIQDITTAVQRFKTVGFDLETSLSSGIDATKLSIVLFGDAEQTANAFARSMRVLVTDVTDAKKSQQEMAEAMALTSQLWETNAFEIDEFTNGIEKFAGTGKAMGLTAKEIITLLALLSTQGLNANRAGKLLSTSFIKLQTNFDKLATVLGIKVNPQLDTTYSIFLKTIEAIAEYKGEKGLDGIVRVAPQVAEAVSEIFGGTKGGEPAFDLVAQDMQKLIPLMKQYASATPDVTKLDQEYKNMNDNLFRQIEIYHNLNKEIGKSFIVGVTGADDFGKAMEKVIIIQKEILKNAKAFGEFTLRVSGAFGGSFLDETAIQKAQQTIKERIEKVKPHISFQIQRWQIPDLDETQLQSAIDDLMKVQLEQIPIGLDNTQINELIMNAQQQLFILKKREGTLNKKNNETLKESNAIILEKQDYLKIEDNIRQQLIASGLDSLEVEKRILAIQEESNHYVEKDIELQKQLIDHLTKMQEIELKRTSERGLIDNQLQLLQLQGASNLELLKAERAYENMYGLKQTQLDQLKYEIELQKEITKEKQAQNSVSDETNKLFQIAKKYGTQTAFNVSEFLKGNLDTGNQNITGTRLGDALNEFFSSVLEARKIFDYFSVGEGRGIPTAETGLGRELPPIVPPTTQQINLPGITTNIENIKIEVKKVLSDKDLGNLVNDALISALKGNTQIQDAIDERIENY